LKTGEIMLLHCDEEWDALGRGGGYDSTAKAKTSAERAYHGVSSCWMDAKISHEAALKFRDEMWAEQRCSFCDKIPPDFNKMIERKQPTNLRPVHRGVSEDPGRRAAVGRVRTWGAAALGESHVIVRSCPGRRVQ